MKPKAYSLVIDVETTGLPKRILHPQWNRYTNDYSSVRIVSIAWIVIDASNANEIEKAYYIVKPMNYLIPEESIRIHGITQEHALANGIELVKVCGYIEKTMKTYACNTLIAHNIQFDVHVVCEELRRIRFFALERKIRSMIRYCTMWAARKIMNLKKIPKLSELYIMLTGDEIQNLHNALSDATNCRVCYAKLIQAA
jgi:DNA polymerase-3 subunit epsilon